MVYSTDVREILKSATFEAWFSRSKDRQAMARIAARIDRLALGNPGDVKPVGSGISEMTIGYGPGHRVCFMHRGSAVVVILCGGDKRTQSADIKRVMKIVTH